MAQLLNAIGINVTKRARVNEPFVQMKLTVKDRLSAALNHCV